jgi:hypothetical protein
VAARSEERMEETVKDPGKQKQWQNDQSSQHKADNA